MRWFLTQEAAGEAGFDDLVAYAQVKLPARAKLELARNYWDEMGRGNIKGMHGPMLDRLVEALALEPAIETTIWESLALANAMTAMATTRRYAFHAIGALGAIELTAPARATATSAGLRRLGIHGKLRHYFDLHAVLDVKHSEAWNARGDRAPGGRGSAPRDGAGGGRADPPQMRRALLRALPANALVNEGDGALVDLLRRLKALDYDFVTVTPATHARIVARPDKKRARTLRDIFGWSLPFERGTLPADLFALLERAGALEPAEGGHRSRLRVSRVGAHLFLHSAYPTDGKDSRLPRPRHLAASSASWRRRSPAAAPRSRGSSTWARAAAPARSAPARLLPGARLTLVDSNPEALRLARINARAAGVAVETVEARLGRRGRRRVRSAHRQPALSDGFRQAAPIATAAA